MTQGPAATLVAVLACAVAVEAQPPAPRNVTTGCVDRFDPGADYFPEKAIVEDAVNFTVDYRRSYKVVTIRDNGGSTEKYVLVQCGAPPPALAGNLAAAQIVTVPVRSAFVHSTTALSPLVALERLDVLTGVASVEYVTSPAVSARVTAGQAIEFARNALVVDVERVVSARPAVLVGGASGSTAAVIRSAGIPVVGNHDWLEPTALARAEWLKYVALFVNEERRSQDMHAATKSRYRATSALASAEPIGRWPLVMTGRSTRGTFVIAGGRSYVAAMIKDAGGRYVWADDTATGAPSIDLEAQIRRAADADIWINGGGWKDLAAMLEDEPRYAAFKAFRQGQVWVYERRQTPAGTNDYWARSMSHPDLVLADLVKIFHPAVATEHSLEWYMKVPSRAK